MARPRKPSDAVRFQVGDKVRVKYGIGPRFPRHPFGWLVRYVTEIIEASGQLRVQTDDRTLSEYPPDLPQAM